MKMKILYLIIIAMAATSLQIQAEKHKEHKGHAEHGEHDKENEHNEHDDQADRDKHDEHYDQDKHDDQDEHENEAIKLSPEVLQEFGIKLGTAAPGTLALETTLPGEIQINQDLLAHVVPRYAGIVLEVKKNIGDQVKEGDIMAILESNDSLTPYPLKTRLQGVVIDKHITLGESLQTDKSVYTIANLENVWVNITLYQKDIPMVRKGQRVTISGGVHLPSAEGTVDYVSPTLDEHTRTGYARVVLPNPDEAWKPGMFITAKIKVGEVAAAIIAPRTAIQTLEDGPSVFVKTPRGFEPRRITLGQSNRTHIEVLSGLKAGDIYVVHGGFTLKAELGRGEMNSGHSH